MTGEDGEGGNSVSNGGVPNGGGLSKGKGSTDNEVVLSDRQKELLKKKIEKQKKKLQVILIVLPNLGILLKQEQIKPLQRLVTKAVIHQEHELKTRNQMKRKVLGVKIHQKINWKVDI